MSAKRIQIKHWQNSIHEPPHESKLSELRARAGMVGKEGDTVAMRIFRLEILMGEVS